MSPEYHISGLKSQSINLMVSLFSVLIIYSMTIKKLCQFSKTKYLYFVLHEAFHLLLHLLFQSVILYGPEWSTKLTFKQLNTI